VLNKLDHSEVVEVDCPMYYAEEEVNVTVNSSPINDHPYSHHGVVQSMVAIATKGILPSGRGKFL
jgi:hypothetical protein